MGQPSRAPADRWRGRRALSRLALRDVTERVGMRAPSRYTHFPSKHASYDVFLDLAVADPVRHQLMNQRTVPGFEPSPEAYAPAVRVLEQGRRFFGERCGADPADDDIWVTMVGGLVNQQLANDPGGTRWSALLDRAVDVWADGVGLPRGRLVPGTETPARPGVSPMRRSSS